MLRGALAVGRLLLSLLPPDTQAVAGLTLGADPIAGSRYCGICLRKSPDSSFNRPQRGKEGHHGLYRGRL
jgi:hypothetical protein